MKPTRWKTKKRGNLINCANASTSVDKLICGTTVLGQLDGMLSAIYQDRSKSTIWQVDRQKLKEEQKTWITERNSCTEITCVEAAYRKRIVELCNIPTVTGIKPKSDCDG